MTNIRYAHSGDLDALTHLVIRSSPSNPQWEYRMRYRKDYPDDHFKYTRMLFEQFIEKENDNWLVMVIEDTRHPTLSEQSDELARRLASGHNIVEASDRASKLLAFAVWDISCLNKRKYGDSFRHQNPQQYVAQHGGSTRKDLDPARHRAFVQSGAKSAAFFKAFEDHQLKLQILGTDPDHRRQGYACQLCRWGMKVAEAEHLVVTLVAGAIGVLLYESLSFQILGTYELHVDGEEEKILSTAMVYKPVTTETSFL